MPETRRLDAGLYETIDGRARIESQSRRLDGVPSDYGTDGWWLTVEGWDEPAGPYDTKSDALEAYRGSNCGCMREDPGDGWGERVVTHSGACHLHPEFTDA